MSINGINSINGIKNNTLNNESKGCLYVVSTPIGNMDDITIRALKILEKVDIIATEDTRSTARMLSYHNIKGKLVSCHEYNESERAIGLIKKIYDGETIALVSEAGTPSISDPGYRLVNEAIANNIKVIPVPGPSAVITALSVSGLPTDSFIFIGFLPKKKSKRNNVLKRLVREKGTIVFYESPKRIIKLLEEIKNIFGDRYGVLSREMTKKYEEFIRGKLSEIQVILDAKTIVKGEFTILISGCGDEEIKLSDKELHLEIIERLSVKGTKPSRLARDLAGETGLPRKIVYEEILKISDNKKNNN